MFAAVTVAALASVNAKMFTANESAQKYMWNEFKREHAKEYSASEDVTRFAHFIENLKLIDERNAEDGAIHGINKFSDMSREEFKSKMLTGKQNVNRSSMKVRAPGAAPATTGVVDWTGVYTTPVKDQGYCGSCWAFSATEQIESDVMRQTGETYILSPQQITSCDKTAFGCGGGWTEHAYEYVQRAGGIETDSDYPYTSGTAGVTGDCKADSSKEVVNIKGYTTINGEDNMATYVQSTGPLSVCVDADTWSTYKSGIMTKCGNQVDHCVQAVGVDASSNGYWKVRNSWGTSWGEDGFIRLAYGQDLCAIASDPTYTDAYVL